VEFVAQETGRYSLIGSKNGSTFSLGNYFTRIEQQPQENERPSDSAIY
jgi:hypothetical protein